MWIAGFPTRELVVTRRSRTPSSTPRRATISNWSLLGDGPVSVAVTGFMNYYDNFILQAQRGVNATTRLLEFEGISGIVSVSYGW
jgi:hypothetical protein